MPVSPTVGAAISLDRQTSLASALAAIDPLSRHARTLPVQPLEARLDIGVERLEARRHEADRRSPWRIQVRDP